MTEEKRVCPICKTEKINVFYTNPLSYQCSFCQFWIHDSNRPSIPVLTEDQARRKRPGMYGDPTCTCCTHAPHSNKPCEFCEEDKKSQ